MERVKTFIQERLLPEEAEKLYQQGAKFEEIMMMYGCALREVQTKLEVLNDELSVRYNRNPIEFIKTRVKKPLSIVNKLQRRGLEVSIESMVENLNDVAGIRVICYFLDDIYDVARWLSSQDDIRLLQVKDYIKNPKPNGYRSLHLIVEVPVFFSKGRQMMRVEVQIRTIAMDFWASVDHQLKYKQDIEDVENADELSAELKECADIIAQTDARMQAIKNKIYPGNALPKTNMDKLKKLTIPLNNREI